MNKLEAAENWFFRETPRPLEIAGKCLLAMGLLVGSLTAFFTQEGLAIPLPLKIYNIALASLSGLTFYALSKAVSARSWLTVPLCALLCWGLMPFAGNDPTGDAQGVQPYVPALIGFWALYVLKYVAILAVMGFVIHLWIKGALK